MIGASPNRSLHMLCTIALIVIVSGCGRKEASPGASPHATRRPDTPTDTQAATPEENRYLQAAKPFIDALASQRYGDAYALLSSHARARMSISQFVPPQDETEAGKNEKAPFLNVASPQFTELVQKGVLPYGTPRSVKNLYVFSTDPKAIGQEKVEGIDGMERMLAIGAMPDSVPAAIRRASVHAQIATDLSTDQLSQTAKNYGVTVEDLTKDPDFAPHFTVKVVLVEEAGALKVGYFEFLPPAMTD